MVALATITCGRGVVSRLLTARRVREIVYEVLNLSSNKKTRVGNDCTDINARIHQHE
jgi:hypothetical protein